MSAVWCLIFMVLLVVGPRFRDLLNCIDCIDCINFSKKFVIGYANVPHRLVDTVGEVGTRHGVLILPLINEGLSLVHSLQVTP